MKKASFVAAFVVSALVIGCQDNSNLSPVSPDGSRAPQGQLIKTTSNPDGFLSLEGEYAYGNAESIDNLFDLSGTAQYTLTQMDGNDYNFALIVDASLSSKGPKAASGKVYAESIETVSLADKYEIVKKAFPISGIEGDIELNVVFIVSPDNVKVDHIWMSAPSPRLARVN